MRINNNHIHHKGYLCIDTNFLYHEQEEYDTVIVNKKLGAM